MQIQPLPCFAISQTSTPGPTLTYTNLCKITKYTYQRILQFSATATFSASDTQLTSCESQQENVQIDKACGVQRSKYDCRLQDWFDTSFHYVHKFCRIRFENSLWISYLQNYLLKVTLGGSTLCNVFKLLFWLVCRLLNWKIWLRFHLCVDNRFRIDHRIWLFVEVTGESLCGEWNIEIGAEWGVNVSGGLCIDSYTPTVYLSHRHHLNLLRLFMAKSPTLI